MHLDIYNNYKKTYENTDTKTNPKVDWVSHIMSLKFIQFLLLFGVFAIVYCIDKLNMFNMMHGFMGPSPLPVFAAQSAEKKKKKGKL